MGSTQGPVRLLKIPTIRIKDAFLGYSAKLGRPDVFRLEKQATGRQAALG